MALIQCGAYAGVPPPAPCYFFAACGGGALNFSLLWTWPARARVSFAPAGRLLWASPAGPGRSLPQGTLSPCRAHLVLALRANSPCHTRVLAACGGGDGFNFSPVRKVAKARIRGPAPLGIPPIFLMRTQRQGLVWSIDGANCGAARQKRLSLRRALWTYRSFGLGALRSIHMKCWCDIHPGPSLPPQFFLRKNRWLYPINRAKGRSKTSNPPQIRCP